MSASTKFFSRLRPYLNEGIRVAIIMGTGDVLAQTAIEQRDLSKFDWKRTLKFSAVGFVIVGPILHRWYNAVEVVVPKEDKPFVRGLKKMLWDQFLFAPLFNVLVIGAFEFLGGEKYEKFKKIMQDDFINIMLVSYSVWPLIQMINFTLMPMHLQVQFAQICGVFWNCYLSLKLNNKI